MFWYVFAHLLLYERPIILNDTGYSTTINLILLITANICISVLDRLLFSSKFEMKLNRLWHDQLLLPNGVFLRAFLDSNFRSKRRTNETSYQRSMDDWENLCFSSEPDELITRCKCHGSSYFVRTGLEYFWKLSVDHSILFMHIMN